MGRGEAGRGIPERGGGGDRADKAGGVRTTEGDETKACGSAGCKESSQEESDTPGVSNLASISVNTISSQS